MQNYQKIEFHGEKNRVSGRKMEFLNFQQNQVSLKTHKNKPVKGELKVDGLRKKLRMKCFVFL